MFLFMTIFFPQFKHCDVLAQVQSIAAGLLNCLCIINAIFLPYKKKVSSKEHESGPVGAILAKHVPGVPGTLTQFNWDHESVGIVLIDFRVMEKDYLIASFGPFS